MNIKPIDQILLEKMAEKERKDLFWHLLKATLYLGG